MSVDWVEHIGEGLKVGAVPLKVRSPKRRKFLLTGNINCPVGVECGNSQASF